VAFIPNRIVVLYALAGQNFCGSKLGGERTANTSTLMRRCYEYIYLHVHERQRHPERQQWVQTNGMTEHGHYPTADCRLPTADCRLPTADCLQHSLSLMLRWHICIHTEILLDVASGDVDQAQAALKRCMVVWFPGVFPEGESISSDLVDTKIGNSWVRTH